MVERTSVRSLYRACTVWGSYVRTPERSSVRTYAELNLSVWPGVEQSPHNPTANAKDRLASATIGSAAIVLTAVLLTRFNDL